MAEQSFRFGDLETADVKLQFFSEDGNKENPVYLHSQVLKTSEVLEAWLSDRWSSDQRPREILKLRGSVSLEIYAKCFQLIYSCAAKEPFCFSGLDEALAILPVVSEWLVREGMEQCMQYIVGCFEAANTSSAKAVTDTCRSALVKEYHVIVLLIRLNQYCGLEERARSAWTSLLWLFDVIRHCDSKLYETFIKMFCDDASLCHSEFIHIGTEVKVEILVDRILKGMGNGQIITPASFRLSFLTNWLDAMVMLIARHPASGEKLAALERGIMDVADTFGLADQKLIYNFWMNVFEGSSLDISNALNWWAQKVLEAIKNGNII